MGFKQIVIDTDIFEKNKKRILNHFLKTGHPIGRNQLFEEVELLAYMSTYELEMCLESLAARGLIDDNKGMRIFYSLTDIGEMVIKEHNQEIEAEKQLKAAQNEKTLIELELSRFKLAHYASERKMRILKVIVAIQSLLVTILTIILANL